MTTIAYRDGVMAADSAIFDRDTYCGEAHKIFQAPDGSLGAVAGCLGDSAAFADWFRLVTAPTCASKAPAFQDEASEGLIIAPDGCAFWVGHGRKMFQINAQFYAIGSGFRVAMGALAQGASALEAVAIACRLDAYSRAPVVTCELKRGA